MSSAALALDIKSEPIGSNVNSPAATRVMLDFWSGLHRFELDWVKFHKQPGVQPNEPLPEDDPEYAFSREFKKRQIVRLRRWRLENRVLTEAEQLQKGFLAYAGIGRIRSLDFWGRGELYDEHWASYHADGKIPADRLLPEDHPEYGPSAKWRLHQIGRVQHLQDHPRNLSEQEKRQFEWLRSRNMTPENKKFVTEDFAICSARYEQACTAYWQEPGVKVGTLIPRNHHRFGVEAQWAHNQQRWAKSVRDEQRILDANEAARMQWLENHHILEKQRANFWESADQFERDCIRCFSQPSLPVGVLFPKDPSYAKSAKFRNTQLTWLTMQDKNDAPTGEQTRRATWLAVHGISLDNRIYLRGQNRATLKLEKTEIAPQQSKTPVQPAVEPLVRGHAA